jgi:hypothetical protein
MFLINPIFSFVAFITIIVLYIWLTKKGLQSDWGDIRGGMFLVLAERASRIAAQFPRHHISWKPDLLVPIDDPQLWAGSLLFIRSITYPSGSIFAFTVKDTNIKQTEQDLNDLLRPLSNENILANSTVIEEKDFLHGAKLVIQTLKGGTFRPNTLFVTMPSKKRKMTIIKQLAEHAVYHDLGIILLQKHPRTAFGMQRSINLWLRDNSPNWHLAVLIALQVQLNWEAKLNLITVTSESEDKKRLYRFLQRLSDQARLPAMTELYVQVGNFKDALETAPKADLNIFGISGKPSFEWIKKSGEIVKSSCLFIGDSGQENALV